MDKRSSATGNRRIAGGSGLQREVFYTLKGDKGGAVLGAWKRILPALLLLMTTTGLLIACGAESTPTPTEVPTDTPAAQTSEDFTWPEILASGKMVVGTSAGYPPFEYYDDNFQLDGLDIAIMKEIGSRLGLEIDFRDMAFDGLGNALLLGQIDVAISAISYTPERDQVVDFSNIYYLSQDAVLANAGSSIEGIPANDELASYRVGVESGTIYEAIVRDNLIETGLMPESNLYLYDQLDQAIADLVAGRIDLVALDLEPAEFAVQQANVKIVAQGLNRQQLAMAVPQGASQLQTELNQTLNILQREGVLNGLINQYMGLLVEGTAPLPPAEPEPGTTTPPATAPGAGCIDSMEYVSDLGYDHQEYTAIPLLPAGQAFEKGWRVKNSGTCTWNTGYSLVPVDGNSPAFRMGGMPVPVNAPVQPGETHDFMVDLVAPIEPGTYVAYWNLRDGSNGLLFGDRLSVAIEAIAVATPTPLPTQTPAPGITFSAAPGLIQQGQCSTINWATTNVQAVYFYEQGEAWQQNGVPGSGTLTVCPLVTTTYELRVVKLDNSVEIRQVTIFIVPNNAAPTITRFTVDPPDVIAVGQCVTIQWSVSGDVNTVTILRNNMALWAGAPFSGAMQDCPPGSGQQIYAIEANGSGGSNQTNWFINVLPASTAVPTSTPTAAAMTPTPAHEPVIYYFTATPNRLSPNQCVAVSWSVGGNSSTVDIYKNSVLVQSGVAFRNQWNDCGNTNFGTVIYLLVAKSNLNQAVNQQASVDIVPNP